MVNEEEILQQLDQSTIQTQSQEQLLLEHMETDKPSFRLGENLQVIVKQGKQLSGRDVDTPYQFGDISWGLFGRMLLNFLLERHTYTRTHIGPTFIHTHTHTHTHTLAAVRHSNKLTGMVGSPWCRSD
jgi:hypothetical protein